LNFERFTSSNPATPVPQTQQAHISIVKDMGLVERVGAAKGTHWVVNAKAP